MKLLSILALPLPLRILATPISRAASPALPALPPTTKPCSIYGTSVLNCWEGPGTTFSAAATVHGGHFYQCSCSATGESIDGNTNWDFIPDGALPGGGCYVPAYYTTTPCGNSTLPQC